MPALVAATAPIATSSSGRHRRERQPPGARGADAPVEQRAEDGTSRAAGRRHEERRHHERRRPPMRRTSSRSSDHGHRPDRRSGRRVRGDGLDRRFGVTALARARHSGFTTITAPRRNAIDGSCADPAHQHPDPVDVDVPAVHLADDAAGVDHDDAVGQVRGSPRARSRSAARRCRRRRRRAAVGPMNSMAPTSRPRVGCAATSTGGRRRQLAGEHDPLLVATRQRRETERRARRTRSRTRR